MRERGAKVNESAARALRSGHPWVFRDSLVRSLDQATSGKIMAVADADGGFLGWGIFEPEGAIALRMVGRDPGMRWSEEVLAARIRAAIGFRDRHLSAGAREACRLVHGEGDGVPGVAVDRLGDFLLVYKYSRAVDPFIDPLVRILVEELDPSGVYLQDRARPVTADERRPPATLVAGKAAPPEIEVQEDGLSFVVDVSAPVSPGLFLDLREGRRLCESLVRDRSVLNLFSFTGAFALRAIRGGARSVTNVDAAARSHARCRQNLAASGMNPDTCEELTGDVFKHLERFRYRKRVFDFVIVDPPPFSRVEGKVFSALRDWSELMAAVSRVVAEDGFVLAVSNASGLAEHELLESMSMGASSSARTVRLVAEGGLPLDFPVPPAFTEGRYLKVKLLHVV